MEFLGVVFIFILLALMPRTVGGIFFWMFLFNKYHFSTENGSPIDIPMMLTMVVLFCLDCSFWKDFLDRK